MNRRLMTRRRDGFTMLELLVVMTIMAIMGAVALPAIGRSMAASNINRSAAVVATTLRESYSLAARRRRPIRLSFDTANKAIFARDDVLPDSLFLRQYFNSKSDLPVQQLAATDTQIVIYPNGMADGAVTVDITISDFRRRVTATRAGQVRVSTP